jgi:site-specific recombinase XerD
MTTTAEAVEQFLASLRTRHAPLNTIKAYTHDLRHFQAAVPSPLAEVTAPQIQAFLQGDEL